MAIEFDCPHCGHHYRLKDELAGKTAACKNCRNKIVIPSTVTIPDDTPLPAPAPSQADLEAAAAALYADEPKEKEPASQVIDVECNFCGHKWTEPLARAGKNTLCPNPECKQRVKIPEPKDEGQYDWRHKKSKLPEGAKQNQEKLEGVQSASEARQVSGKALKEAGALDEELEPRPLRQKIMFVLVPLTLLVGLGFGVRSCIVSRTEGQKDRLMLEAQDEFAASTEALSKDEVPLFTAVVHLAAAEHALRQDEKEKLRESMDHFAKARSALAGAPPSPARNAVAGEVAVALLALGGTEEQAREQTRIRWTPEVGLRTRPNERVFTVYDELQKVLSSLQPAEVEFRYSLARRLTRELAARGQAGMALDLIPVALFGQPAEQAEARAIVALESYRADRASELPRRAAERLRGGPTPASVQMLFLLVKPQNVPLLSPPGAGDAVGESTRVAFTGLWLLEDKAADALALAQRAGRDEERLRALALYADWAADPAPALDTAAAIVGAVKDGKGPKFSPDALLRLARVAGATGKTDLAKKFAEAMPDDSSRAWALGEATRFRLAASPNQRGEDAWAELPDDSTKFRAGHAWGRLWLARHNARISGDRSEEAKAVHAWPTGIAPFGKAGVALGLQDRDK